MSKGFQLPIWLINLDRAEDRREKMTARLAALGLPWTRFPAVDGRAEYGRLIESVDQQAFRKSVSRPVLPGEIGVTHSHMAVWRALIASGAEYGLVLEDDVVFHDDFREALDLAHGLRGHWDFLKLNHIRAKSPLCQVRHGAYRLNAYRGPSTGLGAYLIKAETAARLLPALLPLRRPIDRELDRIHVHRYRHLGLEPWPSHVDDGNVSTITGVGFSEIRKPQWYRRLPDYAERLSTLIGKGRWLRQSGQWPAPCRQVTLRE